MKINKEKDLLILTDDDGNEIETYSIKTEITFEKLMEHILLLKMDKKIEPIPENENYDENEKSLINLINEIISDYNKKVSEFEEYKQQELMSKN